GKDASGKPAGKRVFFGPVRGMTVANRRLLAVDEGAGHIQIFDLARPDAFNTDLAGYAAPQRVRAAGYQGFFGRAPLCSPGSIASHTDQTSGQTYIAIADRCNYRIAVYRWSDIAKASGVAETPSGATLAADKAGAANKTAQPVVAPKRIPAPRRGRVVSVSRPTAKAASASGGKGTVKGLAGASSGKNKKTANDYSDPAISAKEAKKAAKKAKKEKKVKY
ncbi:MAG: hypothetical protein ACREAM_15385, partial [Blastocatellia bacterium]